MSRHTQSNNTIEIAYGFDNMMPEGGYFFQVFDSNAITEENEEGLVLNEGFFAGISKNRMLELMEKYEIKNKQHVERVAMDLPI